MGAYRQYMAKKIAHAEEVNRDAQEFMRKLDKKIGYDPTQPAGKPQARPPQAPRSSAAQTPMRIAEGQQVKAMAPQKRRNPKYQAGEFGVIKRIDRRRNGQISKIWIKWSTRDVLVATPRKHFTVIRGVQGVLQENLDFLKQYGPSTRQGLAKARDDLAQQTQVQDALSDTIHQQLDGVFSPNTANGTATGDTLDYSDAQINKELESLGIF